ncbi:MAG: gfo/Idh/MocA family oxidoreductase, partial [Planctomycetia bacterium]
ESLFTVMGPGCESVSRTSGTDMEVVTGLWSGGRIGTFRGLAAGKKGYGGTAFGADGIGPVGEFGGYDPLVGAIVSFFKTRKSPVEERETLEILAFMEAADESRRRDGGRVTLAEVFSKAEPLARERAAAPLPTK